MKPIDNRTSKRISSFLRVVAEDFNLRQKNVLIRETLRELELALPPIGNKKFTYRSKSTN